MAVLRVENGYFFWDRVLSSIYDPSGYDTLSELSIQKASYEWEPFGDYVKFTAESSAVPSVGGLDPQRGIVFEVAGDNLDLSPGSGTANAIRFGEFYQNVVVVDGESVLETSINSECIFTDLDISDDNILNYIKNYDPSALRAIFSSALSGNDEVYLGPYSDFIYTFSGNDRIFGYGGGDIIYAGEGNDYIDEGSGGENGQYGSKLYGGLGDDTYIIYNANARVIENVGEGLDQVFVADLRGGGQWTLGINVENASLTNSVRYNLVGNAGSNRLTGNDAENMLAGKSGADTLSGLGGADFLTGGAGNDKLYGGLGNDKLIGGAGKDVLNGGEGSDLYVVGVAGDHAAAEFADSGASGIDEVRFTSTTASTLTLYAGDTGIEKAVIGTGTATRAVTTGTTANNIDASALGYGITLIGNAGANALNGGAGNDILDGVLSVPGATGVGASSQFNGDKLYGGLGNDTLILHPGDYGGTYDGGSDTDTLRLDTDPSGPNFTQFYLFGSNVITNVEKIQFNAKTGATTLAIIDGISPVPTLVKGGAGSDSILFNLRAPGSYTVPNVKVANWTNPTSSLSWLGSADMVGLVASGGTGAAGITLNAAAGHSGIHALYAVAGDAILNGTTGLEFLYSRTGGIVKANAGGGNDFLMLAAQYIDPATGKSYGGLATTFAGSVFDGGDGLDWLQIRAPIPIFQGHLVGIEGIILEVGFFKNDNLSVIPTNNLGISATELAGLQTNLAFGGEGQITVRMGGIDGNSFNGAAYTFNSGAAISFVVNGSVQNDTINGTSQADTLIGGDGNDTLTGGAGADTFVFNTKPNGTANADTTTDFLHSDGDRIQFSLEVFDSLGAKGGLSADQFWSGADWTTAHDESDRLIYNSTNGDLFYDADGTGSAASAILVAHLTGHPNLVYGDIQIIA